ncbi:MAG: chorismate mutase [Alphaproteobacteria bacterium]|nr:chorismate mutase [Alphaproteobacteria bacterium]
MNESTSTLAELRREIDRIDDELHSLLMHRAGIVMRVAEAKRRLADDSPPMRPGREAEILRRRCENDQGPLPAVVLARLWREIIAAFTRLQGPVEVALFAPRKSASYWDLARSHFGGGTPINLHASAAVVIDAITARGATFGVLPMPEEDEPAPWWPQLMANGPEAPSIVARLPFVSERGSNDTLEALVIAPMEHEQTSEDRSLVALGSKKEISRARLVGAFRTAGLGAKVLARIPPRGKFAEWLDLLEVDGYLRRGDRRVDQALAGDAGVERAVVLGGYSVPMRVG